MHLNLSYLEGEEIIFDNSAPSHKYYRNLAQVMEERNPI